MIYPLPTSPHKLHESINKWNFKILVHFYNYSRQSRGKALPIVLCISEVQLDSKSPYLVKLWFRNKWCHWKSSLNKNNCHLRSTFYELASGEGPLSEATLLILKASLWCQYYYYPYCKDKDIMIIYGRAETFQE